MSQDTQETMQSFLRDIDTDANLAASIDAARCAFQQAYEANSAVLPREQFLHDLERLEQASELLISASSMLEKYNILTQNYSPLMDELKQRYSDFISDESRRHLTEVVMRPIAIYRLTEAQGVMFHAINVQDPKVRAERLYAGLASVSETIEKYMGYFSVRLREQVRTIATMFLTHPDFNPDAFTDDHVTYDYMIALRNTARSILWQLDNYQDTAEYTVRELLHWVEETSPEWVGDDFEECLDYVNRARKG